MLITASELAPLIKIWIGHVCRLARTKACHHLGEAVRFNAAEVVSATLTASRYVRPTKTAAKGEPSGIARAIQPAQSSTNPPVISIRRRELFPQRLRPPPTYRRSAFLFEFVIAFSFVVITGCLSTMQPLDPADLRGDTESARRLRTHVEWLAAPKLDGRKPGTAGNRQAADYIERSFQESGLEPLSSLFGYRQPISPDLGDNIMAVRPHTDAASPARWIIIGAHYDHLGGGFLGADDNASAVAILLETARTFAPPARYSVLFVAFNTEEPPYFGTAVMGSKFFLDHLPIEIGSPENIQAVAIMDLMGSIHWPLLRDSLFAAGAEKSPSLYRRLKEARVPPLVIRPLGIHLVEEIPVYGHRAFSDYDAFRQAGVPFLFLSAARSPRYHSPTDVPDSLNYERMAATVPWLNHLLALIDLDEHRYEFDAGRLELADEVETFRVLINQAVDPATLIPGTSRWSLRNLREDAEWLRAVPVDQPDRPILKRLERISIRLQCLLADYWWCFMI